ncbi:hypothetical protein AAMO2058_001385700 [Amorphochlora amoebiformis]
MDDYQLGKLIGKGSFGQVYLCVNRKNRKEYVVKKMTLVNVPKKEMESFRLEVQLLSDLAHPGIVEYVESFVTRDSSHLCIVMGYCEGGDLTSFLKKRNGKLLPEKDILNLFVQMTLALHYVHMKNILHRDLKSQNIFLKDGMIQLGDFGISKVLDSTSGFAQTCIGTPYYMSPELFQNKKYNFKSDVWALGCVLYEMTTLKHAFDANSINGLAMKIIRGKYPKISNAYTKSLHSLVASMLQIEPRRRPTIKKILRVKIVEKRLKVYLAKVFQNSETNPRNKRSLQHARDQMKHLGMTKILVEIDQKKRKKVKDMNAQRKQMEERWKEQNIALEKEEKAHKRMEDALRKYKEQQHRIRHRYKSQRERATNRAKMIKRRSNPAEARQQKRLEEAKKRRQALREQRSRAERERLKRAEKLRKKREFDRKKVRDLEQWNRNKPTARGKAKRSVVEDQEEKARSNEKEEIADHMEEQESEIALLAKQREEFEKHILAQDKKPPKCSGGATAQNADDKAKLSPEVKSEPGPENHIVEVGAISGGIAVSAIGEEDDIDEDEIKEEEAYGKELERFVREQYA